MQTHSDKRCGREMQLNGMFISIITQLTKSRANVLLVHIFYHRELVVWLSYVHTLASVWQQELVLDHVLAVVPQHPEPDLSLIHI